jgi:hypothetical protein
MARHAPRIIGARGSIEGVIVLHGTIDRSSASTGIGCRVVAPGWPRVGISPEIELGDE